MEWNIFGMVWNGRFCLSWKMEDLHSIPSYALTETFNRWPSDFVVV